MGPIVVTTTAVFSLLAGRSPTAPVDLVGDYVAARTAGRAVVAHRAIPAWARKYNMNCSSCHYPAPPRLNATGQRFRWAGYRMPEEIGEQVEVTKVENYLAAGLETEYEIDKTSGEPAEVSSFTAPAVGVWYAGPFGRNFSGFGELEFGTDELERIVQVGGVWGGENTFGGFRLGQMHNLVDWGVAGLDALPGASLPAALSAPITGAIPFNLGEHQLGVEGYITTGRNRLSAQILNGIDVEGETANGDMDRRKDFLISNALLLDEAGSGLQGFAYYGTIVGLDPTEPSTASHFWRWGASASTIIRDLELLGGVVFAQDRNLPAAVPNTRGVGAWLSAQYFVAKPALTLYGRLEYGDPDRDAADDGFRRYVVGSVLPLTGPAYLRWLVEYRLGSYDGDRPRQNSFVTALRLNF